MGRRTIDIQIVLPRRRTGDVFEESKHPRQGGKFASSGGGGGAKLDKTAARQAKIKTEQYHVSNHPGMEGQIRTSNAGAVVGHVRQLPNGKHELTRSTNSGTVRLTRGEGTSTHNSRHEALEALRSHRMENAHKLAPHLVK